MLEEIQKKKIRILSFFSHFRQIKRDVKNEKHKELQELVDKVMLNYVTHEYNTSII